MNETVRTERELFDGGPPYRLQRSLGLLKPNEPRMVWRVALAVLVGWVPLAVLTAAQDLALGADRTRSLLFDFAVYARFLIAAPLFIVAEPVCVSRLGRTVRHFLDAGLVRETDRARFDAVVASTRRLRDAVVVELAAVLLAYAVIGALMRDVPSAMIPVWHRSGGSGALAFSAAGWWHVLVSLALLLALFFGWLWRPFLWGRFLWCHVASRLASHPSPPGSHCRAAVCRIFTAGFFAPGNATRGDRRRDGRRPRCPCRSIADRVHPLPGCPGRLHRSPVQRTAAGIHRQAFLYEVARHARIRSAGDWRGRTVLAGLSPVL